MSGLTEIFQKATAAALPAIPITVKLANTTKKPQEKIKKVSKDEPKVVDVKQAEDPERTARTLFVGNVPLPVAQEKAAAKEFRALFAPFGTISSVRYRSLPLKKSLPKKVAVMTGDFGDQHDSCHAYIVMESSSSLPAAISSLNGTLFRQKHLRVDSASNADSKPDSKKSLFLGNLPRKITEESIWRLFESVGPVTNVRIVRDAHRGECKGIGYVAFKDRAMVPLGLQLNGTVIDGRAIRVSKCAKPGYAGKKKEFKRKTKEQSEPVHPAARRKEIKEQRTRYTKINQSRKEERDAKRSHAAPIKSEKSAKRPSKSSASPVNSKKQRKSN